MFLNPGPCGARGACAGVCHVCVCVCVCVCVSLNYFALDLSLSCSTGVRVGAFGIESTLYMLFLYTVMETLEDGIHCGKLLEEI